MKEGEFMQTVREWILDRMKYKRKYGLERMRVLMSLLENPQDDYPIIHVTGTNGKGSTIAMLSSLFVYQGQKVGAFVSPHLIDYTDRFLIDGNVMSEEDFEIVGELVRQAEVTLIDEYEPLSFFEIMTAMALVYFSRKKSRSCFIRSRNWWIIRYNQYCPFNDERDYIDWDGS